jgi:hypothetical protein
MARRVCRRATPATLTGVNGRPTRAWALSTESETPPCSDHPNDSNAAQAKAEVAIASFLKVICMAFSRSLQAPTLKQSASAEMIPCARSRLLNTSIKNNQIGVSNSGQALTYMNNRITANGTTATLTSIQLQ